MAYGKKRKGNISEIYNLLMSCCPEVTQFKLKARKEKLELQISDTYWESACMDAHHNSVNTGFRLIKYKWLIYVTPGELNW